MSSNSQDQCQGGAESGDPHGEVRAQPPGPDAPCAGVDLPAVRRPPEGRRASLARWGPATLLTIAAALLSLYKLGSSPMWNDETASVSISVQHGHALWSAITSDGGSMSAYYMLLHALFLAGLGQSAISVRLISVVALAVMVPFLYDLVLRCWGARVAVIATALVITNRTVISKAQEARGYTLGLLLVVVATWLLTSFLDRPSRPRLVAWAVVSALACYSLLLSPLFALAQVVSLGTLRRRAAEMRSAVIATGLLAVLLVPLALMALHRGTAQIDWITPIGAGSVTTFLYGLIVPGFSTWLRLLMLLAIVVGIVTVGREAVENKAGSLERWHRVLLLSWAGLPLVAVLAISFAVSLLQPGYLIACVPAFAVLGAVGIMTVARSLAEGAARRIAAIRAGESSRAKRGAPVAGLVLGAGAAALFALYPLAATWSRYGAVIENGPGETAYIVGLARPGDGIIFDQPSQRMIFNYYLLADFDKAGRFPLLPAPVWPSARWGTQVAYAADHRVPAPGAIAATEGRFTRIWVVDGGWAPLPRYLAQSRALLASLGRHYLVVGEDDFKGVKVLLFSGSGSLPPGMHPWTGGG